jgi:PRC-barrel domain
MTQPANRPSVTTRSNGGSRSAPTWQSRLTGAPVQGGDGEKLGKVDTVYFDNDTDAPAWAAVTTDRFGGYVLLVPLAQADWDGATLSVPFDMQALKAAPHHDPDAAISPDDEDELYRHYGLSDHGLSDYGLSDHGLSDRRSATDGRHDRTSTPSEQASVDDGDGPGPRDEQRHSDRDELGGDREARSASAGVPGTVEQVTDRARSATSTSIAALAPTPDMSKAVTAWFDMAGDLMKLQQQLFASMLGTGNPNPRNTTKV